MIVVKKGGETMLTGAIVGGIIGLVFVIVRQLMTKNKEKGNDK